MELRSKSADMGVGRAQIVLSLAKNYIVLLLFLVIGPALAFGEAQTESLSCPLGIQMDHPLNVKPLPVDPPISVMVMAAGKGTRLRPFTGLSIDDPKGLAKPAVPFMGIPMIGYPLRYAQQLAPRQIVINTHWLGATVEKATRQVLGAEAADKVYFSDERKIDPEAALESGGGILQAREALEGTDDFVVMNADGVMFFAHDEGLRPMIEAHRQSGAIATLLTSENEEVGHRLSGMRFDKKGILRGFGNFKSRWHATKERLLYGRTNMRHYTGYMIISKRIFARDADGAFKYFSKPKSHIFLDVLMAAMKDGEVVREHYEPNTIWFETGTVEHFNAAVKETLEALENSTPGDGSVNWGRQIQKVISAFRAGLVGAPAEFLLPTTDDARKDRQD